MSDNLQCKTCGTEMLSLLKRYSSDTKVESQVLCQNGHVSDIVEDVPNAEVLRLPLP